MSKKILALLMAGAMVLTMTGCGAGKEQAPASEPTEKTENEADVEDNEETGDFYAAMISDTGGVNDESFNQSAWEGLQEFEIKTGSKVGFMESSQASDYATNFDKLVDEGADIIWGIGFAIADQLLEASSMNPDQLYAIADYEYGDETPDNVAGVVFDVQDSSFMVGYIAGLTTKTDRVGYLGGMKSPTMDYFEYGYKAGVEYAAAELGKEIKVDVQIAESFTDAAKGKAMAASMYNAGSDIIFHAAGAVGVGAIEQAIESDKWIIGVDRDQAYLAPDNMLTSALKIVSMATSKLSEDVMNGVNIGGQTFHYGLAEGAVGIPKENPHLDSEVQEKISLIESEIGNGKIVPPYSEETYAAYDATK